MTPKTDTQTTRLDQTISQRSGVGPNELVGGWQAILSNLLNQMNPYLKRAQIVTFQHLTTDESQIFQQAARQILVPQSVCGIYLPPSVRNQMMYTNQGRDIPADEGRPADDGVLLFSRHSSFDTIVNGLLAHPPCAPAVDVYENGALLAGYVYDSIDACLASITDVIQTHLGG